MPDDADTAAKAAGLYDVPEFPALCRPPDDLCGEHGRIWIQWWQHSKSYRADDPKDWPGCHILDARTSHAARRAEWLRKGLGQLQTVENICRTGTSPQCGPALGRRS
jgi:hypothetical protein